MNISISNLFREKNVILHVSTAVISLVILFTGAEIMTRLLMPFSTVEWRVDEKVGQILVANQRSRWASQDYDETVKTNSEGFHDVDHTIMKPDHTYRIVVVGDSFIEALSAPIASGFTQQLEAMLQEHIVNKNIEVINLGVSGTGSCQHRRMLEIIGIKYSPDLIIMSVLPDNDIWDSYEPLSGAPSKIFYRLKPDNSLEYVPPHYSWEITHIRPWLRKSALLRFMRERISHAPLESWMARVGLLVAPGIRGENTVQYAEWGVYLADHPTPWPDAFLTTMQCIKSSYDISADAGVSFVVMLIGSVAVVENRWDEALLPYQGIESLAWDFDYPFNLVRNLGRENQFLVMDVVEQFREHFKRTRKSNSWVHDGHWNISGNKIAAQLVASYLLANRDHFAPKVSYLNFSQTPTALR